MTKAGFVTFTGFPNAGKSSLLNRIVGEKLAVISPRPQSTRHRVVAIRTQDDTQMVVLDTPGLLSPKHSLHQAMKNSALDALNDADVIVHISDATSPSKIMSLRDAASLDRQPKAPVVAALNKVDLLSAGEREAISAKFPDAVLISTVTGEGIDDLVTAITSLLPEGPYLYPDDELSTMPVRFFCAEFIRETALELLNEELPHALACEIEEFRENSSPIYIRAVLHVERDSQKRIVIGHHGQKIKDIGKISREKIEQFLDKKVYLDLWVKVLPNWRKNRNAVRRLGYGNPDGMA